jgi:hypothetical protein
MRLLLLVTLSLATYFLALLVLYRMVTGNKKIDRIGVAVLAGLLTTALGAITVLMMPSW